MDDTLLTQRLLLRPLREDDRDEFFAINSDPLVCEHLPSTLSRSESDALMDRICAHFAEHGFGLWAVEIPGERSFAGCVGLARPTWTAAFTPCVEIGWRLAPATWGRGIATEAARAALAYGFTKLRLEEIYACTVPANVRSLRVMRRIGLRPDFRYSTDGTFEHPRLPEGHPLRRHVLYVTTQTEWTQTSPYP